MQPRDLKAGSLQKKAAHGLQHNLKRKQTNKAKGTWFGTKISKRW